MANILTDLKEDKKINTLVSYTHNHSNYHTTNESGQTVAHIAKPSPSNEDLEVKQYLITLFRNQPIPPSFFIFHKPSGKKVSY
jgi:hypothetical protein